jgi:hypothetical protein
MEKYKESVKVSTDTNLQYHTIEGVELDWNYTCTNDLVRELFDDIGIPHGLVGLDLDSGLADYITHRPTEHNKENTLRRQMKLGKLISKVTGDEDAARELSGLWKAKREALLGAEVKFTSNGEEALHVYQNGPHSCMTKSDSVAVYDGREGGVKVAYLEVDGKIKARTLVRNDGIKQYIGGYGFTGLLHKLLEDVGWVRGNLNGCKIAKIEKDGFYMCPYQDTVGNVDVHEDHLELNNDGEFDTSNTDGLIGGMYCSRCDRRTLESVMQETAYHGEVCNHCIEAKFVTAYGHDLPVYENDVWDAVVDIVDGEPQFAECYWEHTVWVGDGTRCHEDFLNHYKDWLKAREAAEDADDEEQGDDTDATEEDNEEA